jgi:hypothetical protein
VAGGREVYHIREWSGGVMKNGVKEWWSNGVMVS